VCVCVSEGVRVRVCLSVSVWCMMTWVFIYEEIFSVPVIQKGYKLL